MKSHLTFPRTLLLCMALLSALWMGAAHALPNVDEVQAAAQRGDYPGAEKMMREVVAAKPTSARAQYVLAEILAHQRKFNEAAEHTRRARELDPKITFTDAAKFSAFEQLLQREQAPTTRSGGTPAVTSAAPPAMRSAPVEERASGGGIPVWLIVVGAGLFIWVAVGFMRRRTAAQGQPAMAGGSYGGPSAGYGPNYGPGYGGGTPSNGPGMLGVGLGAAGGFAAGMLAEKMLHGGHDERSIPRDNGNAGGLVPGGFDADADSAGSALTQRDVDFGGGDGWGGGDAGGGSFDGGGGGGGSDDW